jgi:hypothetical protein
VEHWFDTTPDPEIARVVADAEAQARKEVPPPGRAEAPAIAPHLPPPAQIPSAQIPSAQVPSRVNGGSSAHESALPTPPRGTPVVTDEEGRGSTAG